MRNRSATVVFPLPLRPSTATIRGRRPTGQASPRSTETSSDSGATRHGPAAGSTSASILGTSERLVHVGASSPRVLWRTAEAIPSLAEPPADLRRAVLAPFGAASRMLTPGAPPAPSGV